MASAAEKIRYTPEQYLAMERKAEFRSEYRDGFIYEMSRSNRYHCLITGNIGREINTQLKERSGEVYIGAMRVRVSETGLYTYPDVVAISGEARLEDTELDTLLNPTAIVEVLSPLTEAYDRGKKFAHYRRLPSLQEYVLVAQDHVRVERYGRRGGEWLLTEFSNLDETLRLASIGCEVALREIYAKVPLAGGEEPRAITSE